MSQNHTANQRYYANLQNGRFVCGNYMLPGDRVSNLVERGPITEFTDSSRKRLARYLRNAASEYRVFITLTYPPGFGEDGHVCKRDLKAFGERYKRFCGRVCPGRDWGLVWWQEWQSNGRCHIHLFGTHKCHYKRIARWWFEIVGSGSAKHLAAGTQIKKIRGKKRQIIAYATKYAVKNEQKQVPEGYLHPGRFWGVIGARGTVEATTTWSAYQNESPDVQEALRDLRNEMELAEKQGKATKIVIEKEDYRVTMRVWDPDDYGFRDKLKFHVERIAKVIENEK